MTVPAMTARNRSASKQAPSTGESMPIVVKAVPGTPFGKTPRFCLQIESGTVPASDSSITGSAGRKQRHGRAIPATRCWAPIRPRRPRCS